MKRELLLWLVRTENPGPIDDLISGVRIGTFQVGPGEPYQK